MSVLFAWGLVCCAVSSATPAVTYAGFAYAGDAASIPDRFKYTRRYEDFLNKGGCDEARRDGTI